ncbi:hypothetical protein IMCC14465_00560 [alpha proteobacterium IMCC14465]|uniref:Uncharacterized protein n=1 Tax=alpha proteobacterium IMCC14465 TaxID=1220535 RepID=J9DYV7_9PROT|nr:hypothetical protein IMCC14465_00560 [alpha proteobacterium IMCC14465]
MIDIGFTFGIAIYGMIWFVTLFMVLPFGVVTQDEAGDVEPGSPGSAPANLLIGRKLLITTLVASVLFIITYWLLTSDILVGI